MRHQPLASGKSTAGVQAGFSIVSAIFLLLVLSGLGVAMVNFTLVQQTTTTLDMQGQRAYQAARAGVEWGLYTSLIPTSVACAGVPTSFVPAAPSLNGFTVTITCTNAPFNNATPVILARHLTATACNMPRSTEPRCPNPGTQTDYVQRVLEARF